MSQKLAVGRIVHALVDPRVNNDQEVAPAVITRVKSKEESGEDEERVNLRVFLDTGGDLRLTNVPVLDKRPELEEEPNVGVNRRVAFWPPR